ncbi:MAG: DUF1552 domain-containing protein [Lentisphaerales bacterium]|nr:DUF1552 domain-containing protein [Lentisphaerales bacterium]
MQKNLDRRSFLKASGVCMTLPFMPSLLGQSVKGGNGLPKRMVFIDVALGMEASAFFPKQTGKDCKLHGSLTPLEKMRGQFTVLSNVEHIGMAGGHRAQHALLSGVLLSDAAKFREGNLTVDMKAAEHVGIKTRFPSLHFGVAGANNRMSWTRNGNSVPMISDLNQIFKMLFVDDSEKQKQRRQTFLHENNSIIDAVLGQSKSVAQGLDKEDKNKLDEYLSSVRETEKNLQAQKAWINKPKPKVQEPGDFSGRFYAEPEKLYPLYYDLILLALKTDSSRIASLQITGAGGAIQLPGVDVGYHLLSHHGKDEERLKQLHIVEKHHMKELSRFMQKLQSIKEADSNLLDKTAIFFGGCMGNGSSHSNRQLPVLLAGGGFNHQTHKKMPQRTQLNNLYVSMLQNFGMEVDQFGPSNGTLTL